jgi:hypothetical protein
MKNHPRLLSGQLLCRKFQFAFAGMIESYSPRPSRHSGFSSIEADLQLQAYKRSDLKHLAFPPHALWLKTFHPVPTLALPIIPSGKPGLSIPLIPLHLHATYPASPLPGYFEACIVNMRNRSSVVYRHGQGIAHIVDSRSYEQPELARVHFS